MAQRWSGGARRCHRAHAAAACAAGGATVADTSSAERELDGFIDRFQPEIADRTRDALARMKARLPGAVQLVYDNYNALAIGFSPTERTSDAVFSIAVYPRWVSLFFLLNGAGLPDPKGLLRGAGKKARHIVLERAEMLEQSDVQALLAAALAHAPGCMADPAQGRLIIKSVSAKQRPRRPGT